MSIWKDIAHARLCMRCKIIPRSRYNEVRISPECRAKMDAEKERINSLPEIEQIRGIVNGEIDINDCRDLYERLYDRLLSEMPYGTAKARDGDPYEWITNWLCNHHEDLIEDDAS